MSDDLDAAARAIVNRLTDSSGHVKDCEGCAAHIAFVAAALRERERAGMEISAKIAETFCKGYEMEWWQRMKKEITADICRDVATAIRQQAQEGR